MVSKLGSAKRFGARYGKTVKERFAKIEALQRAKHKCPYCSAVKTHRSRNLAMQKMQCKIYRQSLLSCLKW